MTKKQKKMLWRIAISAVLLVFSTVFRHFLPNLPFYVHLAVFLPAYLVVGADVLLDAFSHILRGRVFDEEFLMTVATLGAFAIGEYPEAVFVMLFFRVGELFEGLATRRARASLASLASLVPDEARLLDEEGGEETVDAEDVPVGSRIRVLPGERVPLDGVVCEGHAALDLSMLTGEALPVDTVLGCDVPAGAVSLDGVLILRTVRPKEESTAARILEMVENATDRKARSERFITRFARGYTPIVCALAALVCGLLLLLGMGWRESLYAALSFLVISCPCALVISVPLAFFAGVGCGAKQGILFKGSRELERLASVRAAAFDKTGTLTHGDFTPTAITPVNGVTKEELFFLAAALESASTHPIARSVVRAFSFAYPDTPLPLPENVKETAGGGICGLVEGKPSAIGNAAFLSRMGYDIPEAESDGALLYLVRDGVYIGSIAITDRLRKDTPSALRALREEGLSPLLLLSGDRRAVAEQVADSLALDGVCAECRPADKAAILEEKRKETNKKFLFVGDGINDAPALASADCGMAMGALGTDAASLAADVVLLKDGLSGAADALLIARKTTRIVRGNIIFILTVKGGVMLLSALSLVGMWAAVFADVGVSVIAILFAMRAGRWKK